MAKLYGSLVGAVLQAVTPRFISNFLKDGSEHVIVRDTAAVAVGQAIGDTISLGFMKSSGFMSEGAMIYNDALGAGVTLTIGDVNYPAGLAAAFSAAASGSGALWKTFAPAKMGQPLWQALGYPSDPGGQIELLATIGGAALTTAGNVAWRIIGINR